MCVGQSDSLRVRDHVLRVRDPVLRVRDPVLIPADSRSLLHVNCSPLHGFEMLIDTVLERAAAELSNAVSTSSWQLRSGEWTAFERNVVSSE